MVSLQPRRSLSQVMLTGSIRSISNLRKRSIAERMVLQKELTKEILAKAKKGAVREAISDLQNLSQRFPENWRILVSLGRLQGTAAKYADAREFFKRAAAMAPDHCHPVKVSHLKVRKTFAYLSSLCESYSKINCTAAAAFQLLSQLETAIPGPHARYGRGM